jgi:sulfite reductase (ferredoxin)
METALSAAESTKASSQFLRGPLREELSDSADLFSKPATAVLKFHGIYQQDDRDLRKTGIKQHSAMVRVGVPGGVLTPNQYLAMDRIADEIADGSLRITTRQDIQFHYVPKQDLRTLIQVLNSQYLSTLAACGDVVRNVVSCPAPFVSDERTELGQYVTLLSRSLKPRSQAYYEVWIDGERAVSAEAADETAPDVDPWKVEPLYGAVYLPRKFKIGFAYPGDNTTDVYSNDVGIVPHYDDGALRGFTILAGGGLGQSAGVKASHPRLADPVCSVGTDPEELLEVVTAIVTIHRDFGNRTNRKLARLKYVMDEWGVAKFQEELSARLGRTLTPPKPLSWKRANDYLGWHRQGTDVDGDPIWFVGVRVICGRVRDFAGSHHIKTGLRTIIERFRPGVRLTSQQNLYLSGIADRDRNAIDALMREHGIAEPESLPPILRRAMACPALPTCGQAITESERIMPDVVQDIQTEFDAVGLGGQEVHLRTTGCPNGCARPYTAEIGIVGASIDMYTIYLGASPVGTRLGSVFAKNVRRRQIPVLLRPVIQLYANSREDGEAFGNFCHRLGIAALQEVEGPGELAEATAEKLDQNLLLSR